MKRLLILLILIQVSALATSGNHLSDELSNNILSQEDIEFCKEKPVRFYEYCLTDRRRQKLAEQIFINEKINENSHIKLSETEIESCKLNANPILCENKLRGKKVSEQKKQAAAVSAILETPTYPTASKEPTVVGATRTSNGDGTVLTTGTIYGPVRLDEEDMKKVLACSRGKGGNFSICRAEALVEKRMNLVKESASPSSPPSSSPPPPPSSSVTKSKEKVKDRAPASEPKPMDLGENFVERKELTQVSKNEVPKDEATLEGKKLVKEGLCNKAYRYKVIKSVKKCLKKIDENFSEAFKLERDIEFKIVDNTLDDQRKQLFDKCRESFRMGEARDQCKEEARKKLRAERKKLEEPHKVKYAIFESKAEKIDDVYDKKMNQAVVASCGDRKNRFSHSLEEKGEERRYRQCAAVAKKKFKEKNILELNEEKSALFVSEEELSRVSKKCEKGMFDFLSGNYDECIDRTIASIVHSSPEELVAESTPSPEVKTATEEPPFNCSDSINKEIKSLLERDPDNILGRMVHITSLKIAEKVIGENKNSKTMALSLESYIAKNNNLYNSQKVTNLLDTYRKHGKILDAEFIDKNIKNKKPNYYKSRMTNENISAFLLADIYGNPSTTKFSEVDAAAAWLMGKVGDNSPFKLGSNGTNLLNISVLVYRNINLLKNNLKESRERIGKLLETEEKSLAQKFSDLKDSVENKFSNQCSEFFASQCWQRDDTFNDRVAASFINLGNEIQGKIDIGNDLSGSIAGKYKFNFLPRQFVK